MYIYNLVILSISDNILGGSGGALLFSKLVTFRFCSAQVTNSSTFLFHFWGGGFFSSSFLFIARTRNGKVRKKENNLEPFYVKLFSKMVYPHKTPAEFSFLWEWSASKITEAFVRGAKKSFQQKYVIFDSTFAENFLFSLSSFWNTDSKKSSSRDNEYLYVNLHICILVAQI